MNRSKRILLVALTIMPLVTVAGCGNSGPPQFRSNMVEMNQWQLTSEQQQDIANTLEAMFGTPDEPYVLPETGLNLKLIQLAAGPVRSDASGRETGLYRRQCAHCHGTTGDGMGPTAMILNPYPRDYRQGIFKFKSTERPEKPTLHDLDQIVREGVAGTAMPSFGLLPELQLRSLIEYVRYLSLRGQTEIRLIQATADLSEDEPLLAKTREVLIDEVLAPLAETWTTAAEKIVNPEPKPDTELALSVDRGRELFFGTKAGCVKCHGPGALGDGQTTDYDDWMKPISEIEKEIARQRETLATAELTSEERDAIRRRIEVTSAIVHADALPLRTAQPRNLRQGIYRGGRRPLDIYRRLYSGINGTPMPAVGPGASGGQASLTSEEIWSLVDYVLSLPYESLSRPPRVLKLEEARLPGSASLHE